MLIQIFFQRIWKHLSGMLLQGNIQRWNAVMNADPMWYFLPHFIPLILHQIHFWTYLIVSRIGKICQKITESNLWLIVYPALRHFVQSGASPYEVIWMEFWMERNTSDSSFPSNPSPGFNKILVSFAAEIICERIYYANKRVRPATDRTEGWRRPKIHLNESKMWKPGWTNSAVLLLGRAVRSPLR